MEENRRLEEFQSRFESLYHDHPNKKAFLESEIEGYSKIFDENKLSFSSLEQEDGPLEKYSIPYSSMQIFLIRELYFHFSTRRNDISEIEKDEWNSWVRELNNFALENLSEPTGQKYYYYLACDLKTYLKWLQAKLVDSANDRKETIIKSVYLELIFDKYGSCFEGETLDTWITRFTKQEVEINSIKVEPAAKLGTRRIKLIAILDSIQKITGNDFDFEKFVNTHFGISSFQSTKSRSKKKEEYKTIVKECDRILSK
jgi:hypothetical protein